VPVANGKRNHMFIFCTIVKCLIIVDTEQSEMHRDQMKTTDLDWFFKNKIIQKLRNFDYSPRKRYLIDRNYLMYVWKGDVVQHDVITGEKQIYNFGK